MKKSDIVISVFLLRSDQKKSERDILRILSSVLESSFAIKLNQWDATVDPALATQIITKIGSTKGELTMEFLIRDLDLILKRIS